MNTVEIDDPIVSRATLEAAKAPVRAVGHSIINRVGILFLNVSTGILTARTLHPAGRGELAAMLLWPVFLATATTVGTPSALIYHLRQRKNERASLIVNGLLMVVLFGILAAGAGVFFLPHWLRQYPPQTIRWAQIFLLTLPFWSIQIAGQAALEALELFSLSNVVQTLIPVTTLAGLLLFLALHHLTPITAGIAYTIAIFPTSFTILAFLWRRRVSTSRIAVSLATCRTLLSYGIRSCGIDLLGALALNIDQVLVVGLLSPQAMGSYVVVLSLSRALLLFQSAVVMVLFPKAAGRSPVEIVGMVGKSVRVTTMITATVGVVVCLLGPTLLRLMYGSQYLSAIAALRILVLEVVIQGGVFVMAQAFMAMGRPGIVTILQASGLMLSLPLMLLFIPRYGVAGAATALLISTVARFILLYTGFRLFLKCSPPDVLPRVGDIRELMMFANRAR
ncbi:oligosaccharide flippase family protein [Granulicella arctica]|uniref:oligosaccharide flippase family protein n=1 Tax=Granulicella arctica TaxID=940613 RepID=UPI0021E0DE63|nr:oligosaccharide flippase family protein [Granulicella arctica]